MVFRDEPRSGEGMLRANHDGSAGDGVTIALHPSTRAFEVCAHILSGREQQQQQEIRLRSHCLVIAVWSIVVGVDVMQNGRPCQRLEFSVW